MACSGHPHALKVVLGWDGGVCPIIPRCFCDTDVPFFPHAHDDGVAMRMGKNVVIRTGENVVIRMGKGVVSYV
jgi:hypothetical protein